ncbi:MAG: hypothetical protein V9G15_00185 [Dermatophilaceae bacterium]
MTPGAATGSSPLGGRPWNGWSAEGVVSGESTYQKGSAIRPEFTFARMVRSWGLALAASRMSRRCGPLGFVLWHQETHRRGGDVEVLGGGGMPFVVVGRDE